MGAGIFFSKVVFFYMFFFSTETRHGEVRVWQVPKKAQILMEGTREGSPEGNREERRIKDSTHDQEDILKHQEIESRELKKRNLIISTDSQTLCESSNKRENVSEQETDVCLLQETETDVPQETGVEVLQERETEILSEEGRPLHHHPISTSVSGWFTPKIFTFFA